MLLFDISTFSYKGHKVKQQNHTAIVVKQLKKKSNLFQTSYDWIYSKLLVVLCPISLLLKIQTQTTTQEVTDLPAWHL